MSSFEFLKKNRKLACFLLSDEQLALIDLFNCSQFYRIFVKSKHSS